MFDGQDNNMFDGQDNNMFDRQDNNMFDSKYRKAHQFRVLYSTVR